MAGFPAGLVGNPNGPGKCNVSQLNADTCPAASKIGTVSSSARQDALPLLPPVMSTGDVYNVTPTGNEPARVGMVIRPLGGVLGKISMSGPAAVRVPGDFGLNVTFENIPRTLPVLGGGLPVGIQIQSLSLTLNGVAPGGTKAFLTNPTSCAPATTTASATSYAASTPSTRTSTYTPTGCAGVPFHPTPVFGPSQVTASQQELVWAGVTQPSTEFPRSEATIRNSDVILPVGTGINPARLATVTPCTDAQLNVNSAAPATCPASSQVGVAAIISPLVGTKVGQVFFAAGTPTAPLRQFITIPVTATQTAKFVSTQSILAGGLIKATLSNLPQTPVTTFVLFFTGSPSLLLAPSTCGAHLGAAVFAPWSGTPAVGSFFVQQVVKTASGAACPPTAAAQTASVRSVVPSSAEMSTATRTEVSKRLRNLARRAAGP